MTNARKIVKLDREDVYEIDGRYWMIGTVRRTSSFGEEYCDVMFWEYSRQNPDDWE